MAINRPITFTTKIPNFNNSIQFIRKFISPKSIVAWLMLFPGKTDQISYKSVP